MAGIRHLVNYICRGRRKSLLLLLGVIGAVCFIIGRLSQDAGFFSIFTGSVRARDLSVQDADVIARIPAAPGAEPVFPDPVEQDRIHGHVAAEIKKIVQNKYNKSEKMVKLTTPSAGYVSALNKTWMTWTDIDSPGVYRACVPRPPDEELAEVVTGGLIEETQDMTITKCLGNCNDMGFTYAALGKGTQCFCSDVKGNSSLLHYLNSAHCDVPCSGEKQYNCGGEKFLSLYRTKVTDTRCSNMELKAEGSLPLIALASFPRSGNTWTRQLIERATGLYTGSYYWEHEKLQVFGSKAFPGGNVDYKLKQTICVKSHLALTDHIKEFEGGAVVLVRNPYSALVAEVFRRFMFEKEESPEAAMKYFKTKEWEQFVNHQSQLWKEMAMQWLTHSPRILVIHYEDIQAKTYQELSKIVKFLNVEVDPQRIMCATQEYPSSLSTGVSLGNHGRKTRVYLTYNPFSARMRERIDGYIRTVNESLAAHHQKLLPTDYSVELF